MKHSIKSVYVGVDQSLTEPGMAVLSDTGEVVFAASFPSGKLRGGSRLHWIAERITDSIPHNSCVAGSCLEGPSLDSMHKEFDLGEVSGVVKATLYSLGPEPLVVAPASLKVFTTGNSSAFKEDMINAVKEFWGYDPGGNDNVADALALARVAYAVGTNKVGRRCEADTLVALGVFVGQAPPRKHRIKQGSKDNV